MQKIRELTPEQERRLVEFKQEMEDVALSCEPADFETGDRIIKDLYKRAGEKEPKILHCSSLEACKVAARQHYYLFDRDVDDMGWLFNLRRQLRGHLDSSLRDNIVGFLYLRSRGELDALVRPGLSGLPSSSDNLGFFSRYYNITQCPWMALVTFVQEIGVPIDEPLKAIAAARWGLAQSIGWYMTLDGVAIVCDRPRSISFDESQRLHCETGPAVSFEDGSAAHAWHGVCVPAHWIENRENLSVKEVLAVENAERRAAGAEILGWEELPPYAYRVARMREPTDKDEERLRARIEALGLN